MRIKLSTIKNHEPKRDHGNISDLKQSIQEVGLINPITINQNYELLAGRRRYQAVKELGWDEVDVRILESENALFDFKVAIEENLKRKPLTDVEVATAIKEYHEMKQRILGKAVRGNLATLKQFTECSQCEQSVTCSQWEQVKSNDTSGNNCPQCGQFSQGIREAPDCPHCGQSGGEIQPRSQCEQGQGVRETANDLNISRSAVDKAIQIAKAVEEYPELAKHKGTVALRYLRRKKDEEKILKEKPQLEAEGGRYENSKYQDW